MSNKAKSFLAPEDWQSATAGSKAPVLFLAGTIDMGNSRDWQQEVTQKLSDLSVTILNPRRKDWDKSWKQEAANPQFNEQVTWELDGLEAADIILMNLEADSKSPISLLELGLYARDYKKLILVVCPNGFYRKGNVEIVCNRFEIDLKSICMIHSKRDLSMLQRFLRNIRNER